MITSVGLIDFKNFPYETLRIGPFTVIVGANASGKSNIRDAFRFLHGVGRGYTVADIIGGKYGAGGQVEWGAIRGAPKEISRLRLAGSDTYYGFRLSVRIERGQDIIDYSIGIQSDTTKFGGFRVYQEKLSRGSATVFSSHPGAGDPVELQDDDAHLLLRMGKVGEQRKYGHRIAVRPNQPALTQIEEHTRVRKSHKEVAEYVIGVLGNMRFLDLVPDRMRKPAFPGQTILGDSGENLPTVLRRICSDPDRKKNLIDWTRELTPMDIAGFSFPVDEVTGLVQLVIEEMNHKRVSAYSASDGTLRFLAMLAALLDEDPAKLYFFEEIDNGLHPSRLHLLIDVIERQTAKGKMQVVTTTHSPDLLSMVNDDTYKNMSVVCRIEDTIDAIIRPVSELPNAERLRKSQGLGRLLAGGWMETALAFSDGNKDDGRVME